MRIDYQTFWRGVTNDGRNRCELADAACHRCGGTGKVPKEATQLTFIGKPSDTRACRRCLGDGKIRCSSVLDAHHFVPKRRLSTVQAKQDVRNGVTLCRDHHDLVEQGVLMSPRPPLLQFFLSEHGVTAGKVPTAA